MIPKGIILHLSASSFGDAAQINQWHLENGWSGIGYHFVVLNGKRESSDAYKQTDDGKLEVGRAENIKGAHCKANSMNDCTLGICSIGNPNQLINGAKPAPEKFVKNKYLTNNQLSTLVNKTAQLCIKYKLDPAGTFKHPSTGVTHPVISQHSQHESGKPLCASLHIENIRQEIVKRLGELSDGLNLSPPTTNFPLPFIEENPESIEKELPEFKIPFGESSGPKELDVDVKIDADDNQLNI